MIQIKEDLFAYIGGIVREEGCKPIIVNGMPDHVHILLIHPPHQDLSDLMRVVKTNSSRWVHQRWPERRSFGWQLGYGAFSVSRSGMQDVERYIVAQDEHHSKLTFQEEFVALLKRHDISLDERFLWK